MEGSFKHSFNSFYQDSTIGAILAFRVLGLFRAFRAYGFGFRFILGVNVVGQTVWGSLWRGPKYRELQNSYGCHLAVSVESCYDTPDLSGLSHRSQNRIIRALCKTLTTPQIRNA